MRIGIPRALLYHKNQKLWTTFFDELGVDYIVSPETTKEILRVGSNIAIDETCLSGKVFLGHVDYLIDKCDYIFVPRIAVCGSGTVCTRYMAEFDIVKNLYREKNIKILYYNMDNKKSSEQKEFIKMGKFLSKRASDSKAAYTIAKQTQKYYEMFQYERQKNKLDSEKIKLLVVGHSYNVFDSFIGKNLIDIIKNLNAEPIIAEISPKGECISRSYKISEHMPWTYNRELVGAIDLYKDKIDGIILMTTFPCGPDSMVNDIVVRRIKDKPIVLLTIDGQEGTAGLETRIESFIDIINFKRKEMQYADSTKN